MKKPLLIFDGDCGFCRVWIVRCQTITGDRLQYAPQQEVGARFPEITPNDFAHAVYLIEPDGRQSRAAEAVFRSLSYGDLRWPLWVYEHVPGAKTISEALYRQVATHRPFLSRLTTLLWGQSPVLSTYTLTRHIILKVLALIYFLAFASLGTQVLGLIGSQGIAPAADLLARAGALGAKAYVLVPTLAWISHSDYFLLFLCWGGCALAVLALFDVFPTIIFGLLWLFYLSLVSIGADFLSFQWDALLLESGLLALLLVRSERVGIFMLRWLLFRLMIQSACVKWFSGDPLWRHFTALTVHFQTQPLPNPLSWFIHQFPVTVLQGLCIAVFVIEGFVPFLIFTPRRPRLVGFGLLMLLQIIIILTGNYCFFNLLAIALCLTLIDDATWKKWVRSKTATASSPTVVSGGPTLTLFAIVLFSLSLIFWSWQIGLRPPKPLTFLAQAAYPFRSVNDYGLFAVMTSTRLEIQLEGSDDGKTWRAYEFKYKPQRLDRMPIQIAPFQPRLDWQMWFAALSDYRQNPWFLSFCVRLLKGTPAVLKLLKTNPFPQHPPRYIRASLAEYRFTTPTVRRATGQWWTREDRGLYLPAISLQS
jgi:predicted DCC family thiol-disulfide oxidoreductase YuxK